MRATCIICEFCYRLTLLGLFVRRFCFLGPLEALSLFIALLIIRVVFIFGASWGLIFLKIFIVLWIVFFIKVTCSWSLLFSEFFELSLSKLTIGESSS
jgi:hypothetical protein